MPGDQDFAALGVFVEPQRRRVFEKLLAGGPSTVTALMASLSMGRTLVAFHLGKLVEAGFVDVVGPEAGTGGRGRPAQRYRVTGREIVATVPDRRYDLLAGILLDSMAGARRGEAAQGSALRAARSRGAELARQLAGGSRTADRSDRLGRLEHLLSTIGYAPHRQGQELQVRNCPFDRFRATNTAQVCPLNLALSEGYLEGLGLDQQVQARLQPCPDSCCVVFGPRPD